MLHKTIIMSFVTSKLPHFATRFVISGLIVAINEILPQNLEKLLIFLPVNYYANYAIYSSC